MAITETNTDGIITNRLYATDQNIPFTNRRGFLTRTMTLHSAEGDSTRNNSAEIEKLLPLSNLTSNRLFDLQDGFLQAKHLSGAVAFGVLSWKLSF